MEAFEALRWSLHARRGQFLSRIPHKNGTPESPQWNRKKTASRGAFACILVCGWEGKTYFHSSSFRSRRGRSFLPLYVGEKRHLRPACPRDESSSSSSSESDLHRLRTQPVTCSLTQRGWQSSNAFAGRTFCSRPEKRHHPCTRLKSFKHGARSSGVNILLSR